MKKIVVRNVGAFYQFRKYVRNPIVNFMFNEKLRLVAAMVDFSFGKRIVALDVGCGGGYFTLWLSQRLRGIVIGVDVSKRACLKAKVKSRHEKPAFTADIEILRADIIQLPFRKDSIDIVVCASVLEHIRNLSQAIRQLKDSMKDGGILVAGYPIETQLFLMLFRFLLFLPLHKDLGACVRDPCILGKEQFEKSPSTHKQTFQTIRVLLKKHFFVLAKEKCFFTVLPDLLSFYECAKMVKRSLDACIHA